MSRKRAHIGLKTKLCAALCAMLRWDEATKTFVPVVRYQEAKYLTEEQILSRFAWHHYPIPHAEDGPDVHWNLVPIERPDHDQITAKIDTPGVAKRKRLTKAQEELQHTILEKPCGHQRQPSGKIKGRGFRKDLKKKLSGQVVPKCHG